MARQRGLIPVVLSLLPALALVLTAQVAVTGCASGTNGGRPAGGPGGEMQPHRGPSVYEIITQLDLEPEQMPAVRAALEAAEKERDEIFAGTRPGTDGRRDPSTMDDVRATMDDLTRRTEDRLAELLTAEQMAKYREILHKAELRREQMRTQMSGIPGGARGREGR